MTINDEIVVLANQIANQGKKPTVALIKSKLTNKVPLPTIISTLKTWQHDPSLIVPPKDNDPKTIKQGGNSLEAEKFSEFLNGELAQMKAEIIELKHLIQQLLTQQK